MYGLKGLYLNCIKRFSTLLRLCRARFICISLCAAWFSSITIAQAAPNVWDVLRKQFMLNHAVSQPEVRTQIHWLITHPNYLQKLAQSEPYIYHIVTEIKKRNLPGEIALIPMIESAYDPFAYSGAGAAGLWQLMPGTGSNLGLKRDWWSDGRRSIQPSTDAALNYLTRLGKFFHGNWILAFAAYDSGEGTIARLIKNSRQSNRQVNFWTLPVPQETRAYIPRLLALAEIIQNPGRYHVHLPNIPHIPYFEEVNIGSQIDLNHAAKLAGITYKDLIKLNPGYNRWTTAPYRPYKLLIPADKVEHFSRNLALLPEEQRVSWTRHQVSAGDNLVLIARKYHTTVNLIKELNQLKSNSVKKGQFVLIPNSKNQPATPIKTTAKKVAPRFKAEKQYKIIHIVQRTDSLANIQKRYHVSYRQIRQWNHLPATARLKPGQALIIWRINQAQGSYLVQRGDTLSKIAVRFHTRVGNLTRLNPNISIRALKPGQRINIG